MKKSLFYVIIGAVLMISVVSIVSGFQKSRTLAQLKKTVSTKNDSIKILRKKINDLRIPFKFYYIWPEVSFNNSRVKVNDTLQASGFICASGMTNERNVKSTVVYQFIPETIIQEVVDIDSDSAFVYKHFFSAGLPLDSGVYGNDEFTFRYVPSTPGKYYLRGYFNIPVIDIHNRLIIYKYPFQQVFEAY